MPDFIEVCVSIVNRRRGSGYSKEQKVVMGAKGLQSERCIQVATQTELWREQRKGGFIKAKTTTRNSFMQIKHYWLINSDWLAPICN